MPLLELLAKRNWLSPGWGAVSVLLGAAEGWACLIMTLSQRRAELRDKRNGICLTQLGLPSQNAMDRVAQTRHLYLTVLEAWELRYRGAGKEGFIMRPLVLACRWPPSHRVLTWWMQGERDHTLMCLLILLIRTLILSDQSPPL